MAEQPKSTAERLRGAVEFLGADVEEKLDRFDVDVKKATTEVDPDVTIEAALDRALEFCRDIDMAAEGVDNFLSKLESTRPNDEVLDNYWGWRVMVRIRNKLKSIVGDHQAILDEARRGRQNRAVNDAEIRKQAGYVEGDKHVEDETKRRQEETGVTDRSIGETAAEGVSFVDKTAQSEVLIFMEQTRRLLRNEIAALNKKCMAVVEAGLVKEESDHPDTLSHEIDTLRLHLDPPRDRDNESRL